MPSKPRRFLLRHPGIKGAISDSLPDVPLVSKVLQIIARVVQPIAVDVIDDPSVAVS